MFNIGFSELLLVLLVAFLVVGPKDLPKVARWLGRTVKKSRRLLNEIKKESGWDELEKEVRDVQHDVKDAAKQGDVSAELREAKKSVQDSAEKFGHKHASGNHGNHPDCRTGAGAVRRRQAGGRRQGAGQEHQGLQE